MRLSDMSADCRMCGRELKADSKDSDFATFYCMKCGIYTSIPLDELKEEEKPVATTAPDADQP